MRSADFSIDNTYSQKLLGRIAPREISYQQNVFRRASQARGLREIRQILVKRKQ